MKPLSQSPVPGAHDFARLFAEQQANVRLQLARMVPAAEVEDLVQEVFIKAARALPEFRGEAGVATWLHRIAERTAFDHLRSRRQHEAARTVPLVHPNEPDTAAGAAATIEPGVPAEAPGRLVRTEMGECVREHVARLAPDHRVVIELKDLEGLSNPEIAVRLGVTVATAKIRLHRARQALRRELEHSCEFYRNEDNALACDRRSPPPPVIQSVSPASGFSSKEGPLPACAQRDRAMSPTDNPPMNASSDCGCSGTSNPSSCTAPADSLFTPIAAKFVAIGAAIGANCEPCLRHHVREAEELGISSADIARAVAVAAQVKETPARAILKLAERLTQSGDATTDAKVAPTDCGCQA